VLKARIGIEGTELVCHADAPGVNDARRTLDPVALTAMRGWADRYDGAVRARDADALIAIGRDMAAFLNAGDAWLDRAIDGSTGEIDLEIGVAANPRGNDLLLLDAPWEILTWRHLPLAAVEQRLFRVARRLGAAAEPKQPDHGDVALLFMAADVEGQHMLDYEREESAILDATKTLAVALTVEESGALEFLGETLAREGPFDALHLSCHGDIVADKPILVMERPEGGADAVAVEKLVGALGEEARRPALVVLSACRTAEAGAASAPFAQSLIRAGLANALGWDGSVDDGDATAFAEAFYREIAAGRGVSYAAAVGRRALLLLHLRAPDKGGEHWHLARLYLGPAGGGALCDPARTRRPLRRESGHKAFLDPKGRRVPVATAAAFVGRRRQAQRALAAFRMGTGAGVLLHGIGGQGKSSLAARIANRLPRHETVLVFENYGAIAVLDALRAALPPALQPDFDATWRAPVVADAQNLKPALQDVLESAFRTRDAAARTAPILLVIDDLERILETPKPGENAAAVTGDHAAMLAAIIAAFRDAKETDSRLLLTSRYTFALSDARGDDLAARLIDVAVPSMDPPQRQKQFWAARRIAGISSDVDALTARILVASDGNPGLQDVLTRPLFSGHRDAAEKAIAAVEHWRATGNIPAGETAATEFFKRVSLAAYTGMLTAAEREQLRAATLFTLPVPPKVIEDAGAALGVETPAPAVARLIGLGLLDLFQSPGRLDEAAINPLARPLVAGLDEAHERMAASGAIARLFDLWKEGDRAPPGDQRGLETARLAMLADANATIISRSTYAAASFLFRGLHDARGALNNASRAIDALTARGDVPDVDLLRIAAECAGRLGEPVVRDAFIERAMQILDANPVERAGLLMVRADGLALKGQFDQAEMALNEAELLLKGACDTRGIAIVRGMIAGILQGRGDLGAALRIRQHEQLPVFERLADVRQIGLTLGQIAEILMIRGDLKKAHQILNDEVRPIFERIGDVRSRAIVMGRIAHIFEMQDRFDEAIQIRRDEELPTYRRLGDLRQYAVTMGRIGDMIAARGDLDEALRIRQVEELPAFERLGDVRSRAVTTGKIADILHARGDLDAALAMHAERLPVAEAMGDIDSIAHIRFSMAMIHGGRDGATANEIATAIGELRGSFDLSMKLGRADFIAGIGETLGTILTMLGESDAARAVLTPAMEAASRLGDAAAVARMRAMLDGGGRIKI
jgi:tetratricopeptide (TPR) repeat protein